MTLDYEMCFFKDEMFQKIIITILVSRLVRKKAQTVVNTLVGSKDIKNTEHTFDIFIRKSLEMMDNEVK